MGWVAESSKEMVGRHSDMDTRTSRNTKMEEMVIFMVG
jgi:hypothetical protein